MNKSFIHDDFLLTTRAAKELYHGYAEHEPIIDYHCHLSPQEIAEDQRWTDMSEVWLGADHYKWRQLRACGFSERFCSGRGPDGRADGFARFEAFAQALEKLVGNPLFDWSQLELARYFGITERLSGSSAKRIYAQCNEGLKQPWFSAQGLIRRSQVKVVCTTDDPDDDLSYHDAIAKANFGTKVLPTWRPDRILNEAVREAKDPMAHLAERHDYFAAHGCRVSDYGLGELPTGRHLDYVVECMKLDAKAGWASQLHINCLRNPNAARFLELGVDAGYDTVGEAGGLKILQTIFNRLEKADLLPRTIVYSLNPADALPMTALLGSYQKGPAVGRMQFGAAWWFLDQKYGIRRHLETLMSVGALGTFIGMLTDSRSFLSYARHEYFRRILCQLLGEGVERGELPNDLKWLGSVVADIAYANAKNYFGF